MSKWNFADVWETVADDAARRPRPHPRGPHRRPGRSSTAGPTTWPGGCSGAGVGHQDKVALYLYNCPEYLEATFACFKVGLVPDQHQLPLRRRRARLPVGQRRRRGRGLPRGLRRAHRGHPRPRARRPQLAVGRRRHGRLPGVGDALRGGGRDHRRRRRDGAGPVRAPWGRSPDDLYMLYTGGTTGMPKGVMWRQDDLFARLNGGGFRRYPEDGRHRRRPRRARSRAGPGMTLLPACPLMHGTGGFTALECLSEGGRVVTLTSRQFDPVELLDTVEREQVNGLVIVGDAFAKPILAALDAHPGRWDLSQPGRHHLVGGHVERGDQAGPARATIPACCWSTPSPRRRPSAWAARCRRQRGRRRDRPVHPRARGAGPRRRGPRRRARAPGRPGCWPSGGRIPLGYYKDEAKTAATFRTIDGVRYSVPGDYAEVGRGRLHPPARPGLGVHQHRRARRSTPRRSRRWSRPSTAWLDAVVVGIPDERFGEEIVAVVELAAGTAGRIGRRRDGHRAREGPAGRRTRRRAGSASSPPSVARRRARSTTPATAPRPPSGLGVTPADRPPSAGARRPGQPLLAPWVRTKSLTV